MWHANTEKRKTKSDRKEKNQNAWRKGNLEILGNIGSGHHQISGHERKELKKNISGEPENYSSQNYIAEITSKG